LPRAARSVRAAGRLPVSRYMTEKEPQRGSHAVKALALLPLLLMGAGVWYYLRQHAVVETPSSSSAAFPGQKAPGGEPGPAAKKTVVPPGLEPAPLLALDIRGSEEFKSQVTHALKLIWAADREDFLAIKNSLSAIRNEDKTDFYMDNGRPVAAISKKHAFRSLTWCAGIIAHQAWHASYAMTTKKKNKLPPPLPGQKYERQFDANPMKVNYKGLEDIFEMESRASAFQLKVLKLVGAPASETGPVFRRAPRDFDTAHDGNYALKP